jgi:hypothetical protein
LLSETPSANSYFTFTDVDAYALKNISDNRNVPLEGGGGIHFELVNIPVQINVVGNKGNVPVCCVGMNVSYDKKFNKALSYNNNLSKRNC